MKKVWLKRALAGTLALTMQLSCFASPAMAETSSSTGGGTQDGYRLFDNAGVSEETAGQNVFYFGSTNLTVSEKSEDSYLLKICRGGDAEEEASVTVKFGDYSSLYGENYTVSLYHQDDGELTLNETGFSIVGFLTENADSYTEMTDEEAEAEEEEMLSEFTTQGSANLYDVNGDLISKLSVSQEETEDGEEADETAEPSYEFDVEDVAQSDDLDTNQSDYTTAAQVNLTFAEGETEKYIVITPLYSEEAQGDAQVEITLDNPSDGMYLPDEDYTAFLTIEDEDKVQPAVLSLTDSVLSADGDTVTFTVTREGAINNTVGAKVTTTEITAVQGDDFQGVDAMLYFPMGVTTRTFTLQLNHRYTDKDTQFTVQLSDPVGATFDNDSCLVTILPSEDAQAEEDEDVSLMTGLSVSGAITDGLETSDYDFTVHGYALGTKAYLMSNTSFHLDNRDISYDTWSSCSFYLPKYYYAGIALNWSCGRKFATYGHVRSSYWDASGKETYIYNADDGSRSDVTSTAFFNAPDVVRANAAILTSSWYGKWMEVYQVRMCRMKYNVNLVAADPLEYVGVSSAEEKEYVAAYISGEAQETRAKTIFSGEQITFTTGTGNNYAALTGLQLVDKKGNVLYNISDIDSDAVVFQNGTSVTVTLTENLLAGIGDKLKELGLYTKDSDGRYSGTIYLKPVFSYQDATVNLKSLDVGKASFDGYKDVTLQMHVGDVISFSETADASAQTEDSLTLATAVGDPAYCAAGYDADLYKSADVSTVSAAKIGARYSNGTCSLCLTSACIDLYPRVALADNRVTVSVPKDLVDGGAFDTTQGLFLGECTNGGDSYIYTLSGTDLTSDELYSVVAVPTAEGTVANWTIGNDKTVYSGNVMYLMTGSMAQNNALYLTLADNAKSYTIQGTAYCDNTVLGSAVKTAQTFAACGAALSAGASTASSDMNSGEFTLTEVAASPSTKVPVLVYYNNSVNISYVKTPAVSTTVNMGDLMLSTNNADTAYVENVYFTLGGRSMSAVNALTTTGDKLVMTAEVADGNTYTAVENGTSVEKTETVTGVNFLILDGMTYKIKSVYEASETEDGVWSASIQKFSSEASDSYTAGDLFYVQIVTDRGSSVLEESGETAETYYAPVATPYSIAAGAVDTPQTLTYTLPTSADDILGSDDLQGTKSFAKLPILGNLDLLSVCTGNISFGTLTSTADSLNKQENDNLIPDIADDDDNFSEDDDEEVMSTAEDSYNPSSGGSYWSYPIRISVRTQTLTDGRLRLHIGVVITKNNAKAAEATDGVNSAAAAYQYAQSGKPSEDTSAEKLIYNNNLKNAMRQQVSGLQASFSVSFGAYIDFVFVSNSATGAVSEITEAHMVGAGGYLSFTGNLTYVSYYFLPVVYLPAYLGFTVSASLTGYLGGTEDFTRYLEDDEEDASPTYDDFTSSENVDLNEYLTDPEWSIDFRANATGFAGVGVCNIVGLRLNLGLNFDVNYISRMTEWYPNLDDNYGLSVGASFGGQVDLLITHVSLNGLSVPLKSSGYNEYFAAVSTGQKLIGLVDESGVDLTSSDADVAELAARYNAVMADIESKSATTEQISAHVDSLYDWMYDHADLVDCLASTIFMVYHTDSDFYKLLGDETEDYTVKESVDSTWNGSSFMLRAGYQAATTDTVLTNGYDNPGTQMISLSDGRMIMFFLADPSTLEDSSFCSENQTTVLVYSIFNGMTWSEPLPVDQSATNDYYPNVVKCGDDQLMISWISTPEDKAGIGTDATKEEVIDQYTSMEVFTTMYDVTNDSFSAVEQLTDDSYMQLDPQGVYDSATGDCAVYYITTSPDVDEDGNPVIDDVSLTDFFNVYSGNTYSMLCYRLYDGETSQWVIDYYENEVPRDIPTEYNGDRTAYGKVLGEQEQGQRYLPSVLELLQEKGIVDEDTEALLYTYDTYEDGETVTESEYIDPPISDLAVCEGYNGLAVYAYTVDMDQDLSTNDDTELFLQVYDFWNHKTYLPIQLTDDDYSESRPELVRSGDNTYLFWLAGDSVVMYVNVTELIRDYVDAYGNIVDTYYLDKDENIYYEDSNGIYRVGSDGNEYVDADTVIYYQSTDKDTYGEYYYLDASGTRIFVAEEDILAGGGLVKCSYTFSPTLVTSTGASDSEQPTVNDYQAVMDNDENIYILWTQAVTDELIEDPNEVPAQEVFATAMIQEEDTDQIGWSDPYQLTTSERQLDGVSGAVSSEGQLFLAYNAYDMTYIGDTEEFIKNAVLNDDGTITGNPYTISATDLQVTRLNEIGCMEAASITISDTTPTAGETVSVTAVIDNAGLTTAKEGYTAVFYAEDADGYRTEIPDASFTDSTAIPANGTRTVTFDWTVPENFAGMKIVAAVKETGYWNTSETESDALICAPEYELTIQDVVQQGDSFVASYTITNVGNAASAEGDGIELRFDGLYQSFEKYGLDTDLLATEELPALQPGESTTISTTFQVPMVAFNYIGYDQLDIYVVNADGESYCVDADDLTLRAPVTMTVNGGEDLTLDAGETAEVSVDLGNRWITRLNTVNYSVADESVATVDASGNVTAVGAGTTTLTVSVLPAGTTQTITITVNGSTEPEPETGLEFVDVPEDSYYYQAVLWAFKNGVTAGEDETHFGSDNDCTRAQMVTFLWRVAGSPEPETDTMPFEDVHETNYYYKPVLWAYENGITAGVDDTHFAPDETCTRGQMLTFLWRVADSPEAENGVMPFEDVPEIRYFYKPVLWAYEKNITAGKDDTHFAPDDTVIRKEAVTFIWAYNKQK